MATTTGFVQRLSIFNSGLACAWIGPAPTNTTALFVSRASGDAANVGAFKNSIVDALTTAMASRETVSATHGNSDSEITSLSVGP